MMNPSAPHNSVCKKTHKEKFVDCAETVVYSLSILMWQNNYIGQSGRCVNDCLREHCQNLREKYGGFLDVHCKKCDGSDDPGIISTAD